MATTGDNSARLSCEELECMEEMDEDGDLLWNTCNNIWNNNRESVGPASRCSSSSGCFSSFHSPESELTARRAEQDPVISSDPRVLLNLLQLEQKSSTDLQLHDNIKPYMRKMVANWMLDVCTEQDRDEGVFLLSISLLDRFLACTHIKCTHLQLAAAVCMFIASKSREAFFLNLDKLVAYTDFSITKQDLLEWEMVILQSLGWDTCDVTSNDFIEPLLYNLHQPTFFTSRHRIIRNAQTFACLAATERISALYPPSVLASACLSLSIENLCNKQSLTSSLKTIDINPETILHCRNEIENICKNTLLSNQSDRTSMMDSPSRRISYLSENPVSSLCIPNDVLEISIV